MDLYNTVAEIQQGWHFWHTSMQEKQENLEY